MEAASGAPSWSSAMRIVPFMIVALEAIGGRGQGVFLLIVGTGHVEHAAHQVVEQVVGPVFVLVGTESLGPLGTARHILLAHPHHQGDVGVAEAPEVGQPLAVGHDAMVAAIDHALEVALRPQRVESLPKDAVGVVEGVLVVEDQVVVVGIAPLAVGLGEAVLVVEVASLKVEHHEVVAGGIDLVEEVQQRLVIILLAQLLVGPFGHVGGLGDQGDGGVGSTEMALVAVPVDLVAQALGDIDDGSGGVELATIILVEGGEGFLQRGHGLDIATVGVGEEDAMGAVLAEGAHPGSRVLLHRHKGAHILARGRLADDQQEGVGGGQGMEGPGLQVLHALLLILDVAAVAARVFAHVEVELGQSRAGEEAVAGLEKIMGHRAQQDDDEGAAP